MRVLVLLFTVLMAGCASVPMSDDVHASLVSGQVDRLQLAARCCTEMSSLSVPVLEQPRLLRIDETTPVIDLAGTPLPVLAFTLPNESHDSLAEVFSFGPQKGGSLKLDEITFVHPMYVFLDGEYQQIGSPQSPTVCWGDYDWSSIGVWSHMPIPTGAAYMLVVPSLGKPHQVVDTRRMTGSPIVEAVAEVNKPYLRQVRFAYEGEVAVSLVDSASRRTGRCTH